MSTAKPYRIYPCGDHAVTLELGDTISIPVNEKVITVFHYLQSRQIPGVKDIIPAYHTITLVYDLQYLKMKYPHENIFERVKKELENLVAAATKSSTSSREISIPVCYDVSVAPDLISLAEKSKLTIEEVIQLHSAASYRVYMIGFLPGFAYMGKVDEQIQAPRKAKPRTVVPAGSVGIAGEQTGIYPFHSPGGWQLIGQTPIQLFDTKKEMPCYLQPGDTVKFYSIDLTEFKKLQSV